MTKNRKNAECRYDKEHRRLHRGETVRGEGYEYKHYDIFGRRRSLYAKTLKELREKEKNVDRYHTNGRQTLDQVMQECFRLVACKEVSAKTLIGYIKTYDRYIRPVFGKKNITAIKPIDIKRFYLALHKDKKLKVSTIATVHAVLHRILDFAKDAELITSNPADDKMHCLDMEKRAEHLKKAEALEKELRDKYLDFLLNRCPFSPLTLIVYLMAKCGLRCGEVIGLTASDIDYEAGLIHITHTLSYGYTNSNVDEPENDRKCGYIVSNPKTFTSRRSVPCDDEWIWMQLKKCEGRNRRIKKIRIGEWKGFLFIKDDGTPYTNKDVNNYIQKTARRYNTEETLAAEAEHRKPLLLPEKMTCHIFRRTVATILNNAGYSLPDIQALLGHVDVETTNNNYCCPSLERAREIARTLS